MDTPVYIAALRRLMAGKNWSQAELSARSGVRPNTVSDILNETTPTNPRIDTLTLLARALGAPLWMLFCDDREAVLFTERLRFDVAPDPRTHRANALTLAYADALRSVYLEPPVERPDVVPARELATGTTGQRIGAAHPRTRPAKKRRRS